MPTSRPPWFTCMWPRWTGQWHIAHSIGFMTNQVLKPKHEVSDIIRLHGLHFEKQYSPAVQVRKTLRALTLCRTCALGGHVSECSNCGKQTISYNSCRNRHCPKCQATNRERWIMARENELRECSINCVTFIYALFKVKV